jgi:hypothetical protein
MPVSAGWWRSAVRDRARSATKRDADCCKVSEGYLSTYAPASSILAESEGYKPAEFGRRIEISGESGSRLEFDENVLLEAMPDFVPFLPQKKHDGSARSAAR